MNLSQVVEREVNRSPFVTEAIHADIVNISSLARYIRPSVVASLGEDITTAAISMAIKRLPVSADIQLDKTITRFMKQLGDITVRSELADFSFRNSDTLINCQAGLLTYLQNDKSYFYSFCKGVRETTIICSELLASKVSELFREEDMLMKRSNLSAVSVRLPPTNLDTYGVYYTILKKLAWRGINIVEVLSTSYEISLVVSNDDVEDTFSILLALKHGR